MRRNNKAYRMLLHTKKYYLHSTERMHMQALSASVKALQSKCRTQRNANWSHHQLLSTLLPYCTTNCWQCAKSVQFIQPFSTHCQQQFDSSVIKRAQNMYMGQTFQPSVRANSQEASSSILPWVYPCGNPPILDLGHGASTIYGRDTQEVSFRRFKCVR